MHENALVAIGFVGTLAGAVTALSVNIALVRRKLRRWNANSSILFVMSVGNFGEKQRAMWQRKAGYGREEADVIIKYQLLCLLEILIGFFLSTILATFLGP
jgi:hypothetical protein